MVSFSWITIQNVKRIRGQVNPHIIKSNHHQYLVKKRDRQMIMMLFIQVILFFICITPPGI